MERVLQLNPVLKEPVECFWKESGFPYSERRYLSPELAAALLVATPDEEEAVGKAVIDSLRGNDAIQLQSNDSAEVRRTLKELLQFEQAQIAVEDSIIEGLAKVDAMTTQLDQLCFEEGGDVTSMELDIIIGLDPLQDLVVALTTVQQNLTEHLINRWKLLRLNQAAGTLWVWPQCPRIEYWLLKILGDAYHLHQYAQSHTTLCERSLAALETLQWQLFQDTFVIRTHCSRFLIYSPDFSKPAVQKMEFQHLLHQWFVPEGTPTLSLVTRDQLPAIVKGQQGVISCASSRNNEGHVFHELETGGDQDNGNGTRNMFVRFENVVIGRPDCPPGLNSDKFLVCELNIQLYGGGTLKISAASLPLVTGSNPNQATSAAHFKALASTQFVDSEFCFSRGQMVLPEEVAQRKLLQSVNRYIVAKLGRPLSALNFQCLSSALQGAVNGPTVALEQLVNNRIPRTKVTFSDFLYTFSELTLTHFPLFWKNGLVCGWVKREQVQSLLDGRPVGTMFLRAALSVPGVVVSWKHSDGFVHSLEPWNDQDLRLMTLLERIKKIAPNCSGIPLKWIYPEIPMTELESPLYVAFSVPPPPVERQAIIIPYARIELQPVVRVPNQW